MSQDDNALVEAARELLRAGKYADSVFLSSREQYRQKLQEQRRLARARELEERSLDQSLAKTLNGLAPADEVATAGGLKTQQPTPVQPQAAALESDEKQDARKTEEKSAGGLGAFFDRFKRKNDQKEVPGVGGLDAVVGEQVGGQKNKFSLPKINSFSQMLLLIVMISAILIFAFRLTIPAVMPESVPLGPLTPVKPSIQPTVPLDLKSADWVAPMQQVLLLEGIAFILLTIADARRRSQLSDAIAVIVGVVIVFAPMIPIPGGNLGVVTKMVGFEGTSSVILATVLVVWSSLAGGRDFTPLGCYLGCIGLGGVVFGSLGEVSVMMRIDPASSAMSVRQIIDLLIAKAPANVTLSIWIDILLTMAFFALLYEVLRPTAMTTQGDSGPSLGSLLAMVAGVAVYLIVRMGIYQGPPVSFMVSLAMVLAVGAMTQYEKLPQFVPGKWSVRTMFDPAMLMVAGLALFHVLTGLA